MAEALQQGITENGACQGDLVKTLKNIRDLLNEVQTDHGTNKTTLDACRVAIMELIDDHATNKTTMDESRTAIMELIDDHATNKTTIDESRTAIMELIDDHATFKTVCDDMKTLVNDIRSKLTGLVDNGMVSSAQLAIGTTPANVSNALFMYSVAGVMYSKAAIAAGTAPGNDVIPQNKYGAVALDIGIDGTLDVIEAADNATGYDSAALALAGIAAAAASHVRTGTVSVIKTDGAFTFGTTSLADGATAVVYTSNAGVLAALGAAVATSTPATLTAGDPTASAATLTAGDPTASAATLTAPDPAAAAATLTNSTAITLNKG